MLNDVIEIQQQLKEYFGAGNPIDDGLYLLRINEKPFGVKIFTGKIHSIEPIVSLIETATKMQHGKVKKK